jgi:hypothetical protein
MQAGCAQRFQPDLAAALGYSKHLAGRLSDGPDHSEIAHGSSGSAMSSFEQNHALALSR